MQDKDNFPPNGAQDPGKVAQQATSLLYAGEHFDTDSQNYYLRARWYDSLSGRFNRVDPFSGSRYDPQSLHKYLYAHCNPVNYIDPSGYVVATGSSMEMTVTTKIQAQVNSIQTVRVISTSIVMHKTLTLAMMGMIAATALAVLTFGLVGYKYLAHYADELENRTANTIYKHLDTQPKRYKAAAHAIAAQSMARKHANRIGLRQDEIDDLPIFFVLQSLTPDIYENDRNAIGSHPWWIVLQYVGSANSSLARANRRAACAGKGYLRTVKRPELDEYPFASTFQGGAGASVVPVSTTEHRIQGTHLSWFYRSKLKNQPGWFLVVPLPL